MKLKDMKLVCDCGATVCTIEEVLNKMLEMEIEGYDKKSYDLDDDLYLVSHVHLKCKSCNDRFPEFYLEFDPCDMENARFVN